MTEVRAPMINRAKKMESSEDWYNSKILLNTNNFPTNPAVGGNPTRAIPMKEKQVNRMG